MIGTTDQSCWLAEASKYSVVWSGLKIVSLRYKRLKYDRNLVLDDKVRCGNLGVLRVQNRLKEVVCCNSGQRAERERVTAQ